MGTPKSFKIHFRQTALHVVMIAPLYSTFVLDCEIVGFFLLLHDMAPLPREKKNPDVDRRLAL